MTEAFGAAVHLFLRTRVVGQVANLPPIGNRRAPAVENSLRKRGVSKASCIWPINNRPQATSLPHQMAAEAAGIQ
jgi:hypothetical protein